jgi:capsular polysaccharide transport system ATP-binding protein
VSILVENLHVPGDRSGPKRPLFEGLSLEIGDCGKVGILGSKTSGTSTLLRLICGTKLPEKGMVLRDSRVSWPIPLASFMVPTHSVARNIRFVGRLYGVEDDAFSRRVAELVEIEQFLDTPLGKCPKIVRPRLAFSLGLALDFDLYLFDGSFAPVDKPFKEKASEISAARTTGRGYVLATSLPAEVERNCESAYVLERGRATFFADPGAAVEHFKELLAEENQKQQGGGQKAVEAEDSEEGLGDVDLVGAAVADVFD